MERCACRWTAASGAFADHPSFRPGCRDSFGQTATGSASAGGACSLASVAAADACVDRNVPVAPRPRQLRHQGHPSTEGIQRLHAVVSPPTTAIHALRQPSDALRRRRSATGRGSGTPSHGRRAGGVHFKKFRSTAHAEGSHHHANAPPAETCSRCRFGSSARGTTRTAGRAAPPVARRAAAGHRSPRRLPRRSSRRFRPAVDARCPHAEPPREE